MTKKEAIRELKRLRRNILVVLKSMTAEMAKETSTPTRLSTLADQGILAVQFASGLKFFLGGTKEIPELSFEDVLLYRKEAQAFLTILRAIRAARF